jgi:hypothetical protein
LEPFKLKLHDEKSFLFHWFTNIAILNNVILKHDTAKDSIVIKRTTAALSQDKLSENLFLTMKEIICNIESKGCLVRMCHIKQQ